MDFRPFIAQQATNAQYVLRAGTNRHGAERYVTGIYADGDIYTAATSLTNALRFTTREQAEDAARKCGLKTDEVTNL